MHDEPYPKNEDTKPHPPPQNKFSRLPIQTNRSFRPIEAAKSKMKIKRQMPAFWYKLGTKGKFMSVAGLVLILGLASFAVYTNFISSARGSTQTSVGAIKAKPITVASPLTGLQVAPDLAQRPVTAIMIENSPDARPQSGLDQAGVVYEAIAEGGITRFVALYQEAMPTYIGPVRSLRPYYIDWFTPFDASIAHVGGSPESLAEIRSNGKDLDQFFNDASYWREPSRAAPHNVYTSFERLNALNTSKGYTTSTVQSWSRKSDQVLKIPTAKTIDMRISSPLYYSHYDWGAADNTYARSEGGAGHNQVNSPSDKVGVPIHPKVVIAMVIGYGFESDGIHSDYTTTGSGTLYVFQDGGVTQGTWTKAGQASQISFTDTNSQPIKLNAGQVWVTAIQSGQVSYAP